MYQASRAWRTAGRLAAVCAAGLWLLSLPAEAQETFGQGVLNAFSYEAIPPGPTAVQLLDNSDENLAIRDKIIAALAARGTEIDEGAPASVMVVSAREDPGAYFAPQVQEPARLADQGGRLSVRGEVDIPRLIEAPLAKSEVTTASSYELRLVIEDAGSGRSLWEGWARAPLSDGPPETLADRMIPHLLDKIGQTVRAETFELY